MTGSGYSLKPAAIQLHLNAYRNLPPSQVYSFCYFHVFVDCSQVLHLDMYFYDGSNW